MMDEGITKELLDYMWVEVYLSDAFIGILGPPVLAIGLNKHEKNWEVLFFLSEPLDEDLTTDLQEAVGDAESYLSQMPAESDFYTKDVFKPIIRKFIVTHDYNIRDAGKQSERLIFASRPENT